MKRCLEILPDLQRLEQTRIGPFSDSVMRPQEDVRAFATLSGSLEFFGDLLLGFHLNGNPHLLFEFLAELNPRSDSPCYRLPR